MTRLARRIVAKPLPMPIPNRAYVCRSFSSPLQRVRWRLTYVAGDFRSAIS